MRVVECGALGEAVEGKGREREREREREERGKREKRMAVVSHFFFLSIYLSIYLFPSFPSTSDQKGLVIECLIYRREKPLIGCCVAGQTLAKLISNPFFPLFQ